MRQLDANVRIGDLKRVVLVFQDQNGSIRTMSSLVHGEDVQSIVDEVQRVTVL